MNIDMSLSCRSCHITARHQSTRKGGNFFNSEQPFYVSVCPHPVFLVKSYDAIFIRNGYFNDDTQILSVHTQWYTYLQRHWLWAATVWWRCPVMFAKVQFKTMPVWPGQGIRPHVTRNGRFTSPACQIQQSIIEKKELTPVVKPLTSRILRIFHNKGNHSKSLSQTHIISCNRRKHWTVKHA